MRIGLILILSLAGWWIPAVLLVAGLALLGEFRRRRSARLA